MCQVDWISDWVAGVDMAALDAARIRLAVVLPVTVPQLQRFVGRGSTPDRVAARLFCDPTSAAFAALGFNFKFDSRAEFTSIHAQTSVLGAVWKGLVAGIAGGGMQGDPRQQGGAFVIRAAGSRGRGRGKQAAPACVWAHFDRHNADQVPIPVLLAAAGAPAAAYVHPRASPSAGEAAGTE
jgi:hypothetical protein